MHIAIFGQQGWNTPWCYTIPFHLSSERVLMCVSIKFLLFQTNLAICAVYQQQEASVSRKNAREMFLFYTLFCVNFRNNCKNLRRSAGPEIIKLTCPAAMPLSKPIKSFFLVWIFDVN